MRWTPVAHSDTIFNLPSQKLKIASRVTDHEVFSETTVDPAN